jgi:hypothetical protein
LTLRKSVEGVGVVIRSDRLALLVRLVAGVVVAAAATSSA